MKKITTLTDEQKAALKAHADMWIKIGLATGATDRARAEGGIRRYYEIAGMEPPPIVWVSSPLVGALAAPLAANTIAALRGKSGSAVGSAVGSEIDSVVYSAVGSAVGSETDSVVRSTIGSVVGSVVCSAVGSEIDSAVGSVVYSAVDSARAWWHSWIGGSLWCWWPAYASAFRDVLGADLPADFAATYEAATACSYWWPNRDFVLACDLPASISRDDDGRLHSETGPSIAWSDGFALHSWHSTTVPAAWIERKADLDPKTALTHENVELRRAAAEIVGWRRVLEHVSARVVDKDPDPEIGELLDVDLPDSPGSRFLRVRCGTGREFVLPVPAEMKTALQANAWTYGLDGSEYRPEVRT